jgi:threonine dehydrogenase-like Zn-dependent dehydrogenase
MKAILLPGNKQVTLVDKEKPHPKRGEVLIRTRVSALCRSDMSLYYGDPIVGGTMAGTGLVVPGHEPCGDVAELGEGCSGLALGDRVAIYLAVGCGRCSHCLKGDRVLCPQWKCLGFDLDGGDADYLVAPAENCLRLPDSLSYEAGALLTDMVGTQYHTQKRLCVSGATTVAVFGIGPMGGAAVLVAKARGARVIAVDVLSLRLELAKELGADEVLDAGQEDSEECIVALTRGEGVDVAIDCSGMPTAQNAALNTARKGGSVAFVGESRETTINPSDQMIRKMLTVIGAWYFPLWEFAEIAAFATAHRLDIERLITHRFSLAEAEQAFSLFDARETGKVVFVWGEAS